MQGTTMQSSRQPKSRTFFAEKVLLIQAGTYGVLLFGIFYSAYYWLITKDWVRDDYNYAYLVPLITGYLIWEKRRIL